MRRGARRGGPTRPIRGERGAGRKICEASPTRLDYSTRVATATATACYTTHDSVRLAGPPSGITTRRPTHDRQKMRNEKKKKN